MAMTPRPSLADEILERSEKATPGPWYFDSGNGEIESQDSKHNRITVALRESLSDRISHCEHFELGYSPPDFPVHPDEDMDYIAFLGSAAPECARRLKRAIEALRKMSLADGYEAWAQFADELERPL